MQVLARVPVGEAAAGVGAELRQRLLEPVVGDAERAHGGRLGRDPELAHLSAHRNHLRHAGDREQPWPDREVGEVAQLHRRDRATLDRGHDDLAHDRGDRPQQRVDVRRQLAAHHRQPLRDLLAVAVDVGVPVELDVDHRQADARDRAHADHAGQAVHLRLDREADELFDLRRRQPFGLGHDRDGRPVEVGKHVDRQPAHREGAVDHENRGEREHHQPVAQRLRDEECEHRCLTGPG